jgi:hypothetical protein
MTATFRQAMLRVIFWRGKARAHRLRLDPVSDISAAGSQGDHTTCGHVQKSSVGKCMAAMNGGIGTENPDSLHSSITWINPLARE